MPFYLQLYLREWPLNGWPGEPLPLPIQALQLWLFKPSPSMVAIFSHMYSFAPSFHLPNGLALPFGPSVSLTCAFFTNYTLFIPSACPNYLKVFFSYPFHHPTLRFICMSLHTTAFIPLFVPLTIPSCHYTLFQKTTIRTILYQVVKGMVNSVTQVR